MKMRALYLIMMLGLIALAGCGPLSEAQEQPQLKFEVAMEVNSDQEFHISLSVRNVGGRRFGGDERFNGEMEIRYLPSRELRASAQVVPMRSLAPDEAAWPMDWHGQLDAGTYELTWGAEGYGSTTEEFAIVEKDGRLYFEGSPLAMREPEEPQTEERDALVALAISDLQRRLELEAEEIRVEGVEPRTFPDASLGVPEPDQSYAQVMVSGYAIELAVNGEVYRYHGDGGRVVLASERSQEGGSDGAIAEYQTVSLSEIGLRFEVPADWERLEPELAWTPHDGGELRIGFEWMTLEPPMEPEAVMLPGQAQIVDSTPIDLGWAEGRHFTLEVYAAVAEDEDGLAPIDSVQAHVLVTLNQDDERLGLHFYASAPDAQGLNDLEPGLQHMLSTARLTEGS